MRIYQVLVMGSFVALAACTEEDRAASAPVSEVVLANDVGDATVPSGEPSNRPEGAVDPMRPPPTQ